MRVLCVTKGSVNDFCERYDYIEGNILAFGFNGLGLVDFKKELEGETEYFQDLAKLSKEREGVVISGCDTDNYGAVRRSVAVCDRGKLLGVSDAVNVNVGSEYSSGTEYAVYNTGSGKIGVAVSSDLYSVECLNTLALSGADVIVSVIGETTDFSAFTVARAGTLLFGVPVIVISTGFAFAATCGEVAFSGRGIVEGILTQDKKYRTFVRKVREK